MDGGASPVSRTGLWSSCGTGFGPSKPSFRMQSVVLVNAYLGHDEGADHVAQSIKQTFFGLRAFESYIFGDSNPTPEEKTLLAAMGGAFGARAIYTSGRALSRWQGP